MNDADVVAGSVYLVVERVWECNSDWTLADGLRMGEGAFYDWPDVLPGPFQKNDGHNPIKAFTGYPAAVAYRDRLDAEVRVGRNPFLYGETLADITRMPLEMLRDRLLDDSLELPPRAELTLAELRQWWDATVPTMTDLQRAKAWQALDGVRFYDVVELTE